MKYCKTCKHWGAPYYPPEYESSPIGFDVRRCMAAPHIEDATEWRHGMGRLVTVEAHEKTLAFCADEMLEVAEFYTRAEYGCPMHEERQS